MLSIVKISFENYPKTHVYVTFNRIIIPDAYPRNSPGSLHPVKLDSQPFSLAPCTPPTRPASVTFGCGWFLLLKVTFQVLCAFQSAIAATNHIQKSMGMAVCQ